MKPIGLLFVLGFLLHKKATKMVRIEQRNIASNIYREREIPFAKLVPHSYVIGKNQTQELINFWTRKRF